MKKLTTIILSLILLLTLLLSLTGCAKSYYLDYDELKSTVKQIYIVDVVRVGYWGYISKTLLKEIVGQDFDAMLEDLSKLRYKYVTSGKQPEHNTGKAIMLVCEDETCDYIIVGPQGMEKFKDGDQTHFQYVHCDADTFNNLLDKYSV